MIAKKLATLTATRRQSANNKDSILHPCTNFNKECNFALIAKAHEARRLILDNAKEALKAAKREACPNCGAVLTVDEFGVVTCPRCKHSTDAVSHIAGCRYQDFTKATLAACRVIRGEGGRAYA